MTSSSSARRAPGRPGPLPPTPPSRWQDRRLRVLAAVVTVLAIAVAALAVIFFRSTAGKGSVASTAGGGSAENGLAGKYPFQIGRPRPGEMAQPIRLRATDGTTFDLAALKGQTVLVFFQEGVGCQPCWDQIKDIEKNFGQFQALGIDKFVSVTTDPLPALKQKVEDEHLSTPVLSDGGAVVSKSYDANKYGMMGDQMDGHSFVLVNKDGVVSWRADYGGSPKYTMYMPVPNLLADISKGLNVEGTKVGQ